MKSDVHIRVASPDESALIAEVIREAFAEFESFYTPEAFAATILNVEKIFERFQEGTIWVVLKNKKVVGTVSVKADGKKLYIRSMAIRPSAQGSGIGRRLLKEIENFAVENGFETLFLYTTPFLTGAIKLYEQNGFGRTGEGNADEFFGTRWFEMRKELI